MTPQPLPDLERSEIGDCECFPLKSRPDADCGIPPFKQMKGGRLQHPLLTLWGAVSEVVRPEHLTNFGLALPARPVFLVQFHEAYRPFDRLCFRLQIELCIAADNFLGLGERPVGHSHLPAGKTDTRPQSGWPQPATSEHLARFGF